MPLYTKLPTTIDEVDIIIAGGGTAGCIVASRLSDADPSLSVLLIERGSNNYELPNITKPAFMFTHVIPGSKTTTFHKGSKEEQLTDREVIVPSGKILGGGSSVNFLMYTRAQRSDFDSWQTPGWSADDMLPYLKKLETYHGSGPKDRHGYEGPVHVSGGTYRVPRSEDDFIAAAKGVGWTELEDAQDLDSNNGVQRAMRYISPDGQRQDVAHTYLHPRLRDGKHPNLHVVVESQVVRILFEKQKATGVEYVSDPDADLQPSPTQVQDSVRRIRARKLVIASCGTFGTPTLLERSGIGNREILNRAGVSDVVAHIPGVGEAYNDHHLMVYSYRSSLAPEETMDALAGGRLDPGELMKNNDKILGWNAMDITCKLRPSEADVASLGPNFQEAWDRDFKTNTNKPLVLMSLINTFPSLPIGLPVGQYLAVSAFSIYPYSRGRLHITGTALSDPINFVTGFFSDPQGIDIKKCVWAYKKQREIVRRMENYRGEVPATHPPFPAESKAACIEIGEPIGPTVVDIEYTPEDDMIIEHWLRENVATAWHSLGTCKMAPLDKMGVVDANLNVHGVKNLKVIDLSIPPLDVAANTNNTAMAIGEKGADICIDELALA
ncbi:alcohol oxidase-like protein [Xylaria bambusicola]|uniref:alcohol oxidase-like protein n=1 Tax=Xylaria bambusicola TaxID=326684 RepID=UPI002007D726|nr:alcohol oxidase-like protein [Xylaria bambusicola]KAI0520876.1 alcohol oxidase-like protein [Xylaria bambusicola]